MSISKSIFDVLVIGGGPAGLSATLALSRALHTVVMFDSGVYRNGKSKHMHMVPGWDHQEPAKFRDAARKELQERYKDYARIEDHAIEKIVKLENGMFTATDATQKEWTGRKVVLATGSRDIFPDIPGYDECWVKGIFHCLLCHGFENRGARSIGILAIGDVGNLPFASHLMLQARPFSQKVTAYTNGSELLASELNAFLTTKNVQADPRPIKRLIKTPGNTAEVTIVFDNDERETVDFLVHKPKTESGAPFAEQLGLELTPAGDLKVGSPLPETNVPGVFAAGDCSTGLKMIAGALAAGVTAVAGISMQIQKEI